jgi:hypothetical protein
MVQLQTPTYRQSHVSGKVWIMFNWFSRNRRSRSSPGLHRVRPWLEALEARTCPTAASPSAPLLNLCVVHPSPQVSEIKGAVIDTNPSGDTVTLSGGVNAAVHVNADGTFEYDVQASGVGTIVGTIINNATLSASAQTVFVDGTSNPVITSFGADHGYGNVWTFSGQVQSQAGGPISLQFGGLVTLQTKTATCNSDGSFTVTILLSTSQNDTGLATVIATDANGSSQTAGFWIVSAN